MLAGALKRENWIASAKKVLIKKSFVSGFANSEKFEFTVVFAYFESKSDEKNVFFTDAI